jgi:hypothetical protein
MEKTELSAVNKINWKNYMYILTDTEMGRLEA